MNPWTEEVDRLRRHLAELDAMIFRAGSAELRAVRQRQREEDREAMRRIQGGDDEHRN